MVGALCATLGMGSLIFGIIESSEHGWGSTRVVAALVTGLVLLGILVLNESRVTQRIIPLRLFRSRERSGAYAARLLYLGAMIGFFYFTTQLMQDGLGFSPLQAGLGFLPMSLVNFAVAMAIPRLSARISNAVLLTGGIALWRSRSRSSVSPQRGRSSSRTDLPAASRQQLPGLTCGQSNAMPRT